MPTKHALQAPLRGPESAHAGDRRVVKPVPFFAYARMNDAQITPYGCGAEGHILQERESAGRRSQTVQAGTGAVTGRPTL
ncbi:hypothetical protein GCM10027440_42520 [Nocardiopsis coralliicola]